MNATHMSSHRYRYVYQLKLAGAVAIYVPLRPPQGAPTEILSGNDWTLDMAELEKAISPRTKAIVRSP